MRKQNKRKFIFIFKSCIGSGTKTLLFRLNKSDLKRCEIHCHIFCKLYQIITMKTIDFSIFSYSIHTKVTFYEAQVLIWSISDLTGKLATILYLSSTVDSHFHLPIWLSLYRYTKVVFESELDQVTTYLIISVSCAHT